jgi:hypothetical protein
VSRRNTEREWAASQLGGYHNVNKFYPTLDKSQVPSSETVIATLENNDMAEGSQIPVGSDQLHDIHIPVHLSVIVPLAQAFTQDPRAINVVKATQLIEVMIPHLGAHIQILAQDPTREQQVKGYVDTIKQVIQVYQQMAAAVRQAGAQLQQQTEARESELQDLRRRADENEVKLAAEKHRIDKEMELRRLDTESLNETRLAKLRTSIQAEMQKTISSIVNEQLKTQAKIANDQTLTQSKVSAGAT